jgi:hypothetical protein
MATWERLHASALILVVAIDQILAFERRVSDITGDTELAAARTEFDGVAPHADALRDIVAHLDSYAVGEGFRQKGGGVRRSAARTWGRLSGGQRTGAHARVRRRAFGPAFGGGPGSRSRRRR